NDPNANVRLSFAGSDELAAQIRQGVKPDVFAAANTKLPDALFAEGRVDKPGSVATNELVLAVPAVSAAEPTRLPAPLFAEGRVEKPVSFATNELVVAVPADSGKVTSVDDLA